MFQKMIEETEKRREDDAKRFLEMDDDLCQICHAYGSDKRGWTMSCLYAVHEVIPEAIDLYSLPEDHKMKNRGYYLRLCKSCRAAFLSALGRAAGERRILRDFPKDHDGDIEELDPERNIPVRINGAIVYLTREEWESRQAAAQC